MDGWTGRILRVDLTRGEYSVEDLDPELAAKFLGGRGLAAKFLFDEVDPKIDPLSPENKLLFSTGPLCGSGALASGRFEVVTKSPLTGAITDSSGGGYFGSTLKYAGYDLIILEGKSPNPVYLLIQDDEVEIKSAQHLWGKSIPDAESIIKSEAGDKWTGREIQIASIGPAGENLVRFASIMHLDHAAARSGVGAVMGSKNLKAVAVRGTRGVTLADGETFKKLNLSYITAIRESPDLQKLYDSRTTYGTCSSISLAQRTGMIAHRNFQEGSFEPMMDGEKLIRREFWTKDHSCFSCPLQERKIGRVTDPDFKSEGGGPEWETVGLLGANCGVSNFAAILKANYLCNELGIDTMDAGITIGCAMELYEKGFLPEKDAGYKLNFGNDKAMVELVEKIAFRQDFGDTLAEGGYRLAEKYGHPELFMGVKKQGFAGWHPQGNLHYGLAYATSNRGACHCKSIAFWAKSRFDVEGQAIEVKGSQDHVAALSSCGCCWYIYGRFYGLWKEKMMPLLLAAATGVDYNEENLELAGERAYNLERLFNLRAGFTRADDTLPKRILEVPLLKDDAEGKLPRLDVLLPEYYQLRGWDKNGVPTPEKLDQLGLTEEGMICGIPALEKVTR
ncbi:MAG TPA: aldehyde ferredoxin oxidoreductase family protein [Dehalococcoidales bacterium]|nr:aldehyde ferredoxin oxidoreductase family protein [Dehalococcoidales bacterium]